ncbi:MAG: hypothetical protein ACI9GW_003102 [Halieaceae bacterium]|jgi:hypothetical protein
MQRLAFSLIFLLSLSACKVVVEVPEGGYVVSQSGANDCIPLDDGLSAPLGSLVDNGRYRSLPGSGNVSAQHDENFHCEIEINDASFNESLTAVPYDGYQFSHWKEGGMYGGAVNDTVQLVTVGFDSVDVLLALLASNVSYDLQPVFERVSIDGNESDCSRFSGSFERIQDIIFEGYDCTNSACHSGSNASGGLDLSPSVAYNNLFRVNSAASLVDPLQLVYPGEQNLSFLFHKLEAATAGTALPAGGGGAMPVGGAISADHLEALRLWIRNGAPEETDVDDVATLLGCDQPTPLQANKIDPPAAPPIGEGVQLVSGPWAVQPDSENEVCYATYYDLEKTPGLLPEWAKTSCEGGIFDDYTGSCFAVDSQTLTQDPQSHHSIINVYVGTTPVDDPSWGEWQCLNGPSVGMSCDPTRIGEPVAAGGADCGGDLFVCGTPAKKSIACVGWGAGDQRYKSVSLGGSQAPISASVLQDGVYSVVPSKGVIAWNSHAFNLSDEATTIEQYNSFTFAAADARVYRNRGIFDARNIFVASVPPYEERTYCSAWTLPQGARLTTLSSHMHQRGVFWQSWLPPQEPSCKPWNGCTPNTEPADYVSRLYNDPSYLDYKPPLPYDGASDADRTIKFCATYDNGLNYPDLLKRNSTSVGSTCYGAAFCAGGATPGLACGSDDSVCGDGGVCDACPVTGGFTTEDEMFLLLGSYYIVPESERN